MFRRKQPSGNMAQPQTPTANPLPPGYHNATLAQISILRRQGKRTRTGYQPSGWDLVDTYSQQVIAEYNDETAPPPAYMPRNKIWSAPHIGRITGHGRSPLAPTGSELGEMFQAIYTLCYNTTMDAMNLMAEAIPAHQHSADGQPIAALTIHAGIYHTVASRLAADLMSSNEEGNPF